MILRHQLKTVEGTVVYKLLQCSRARLLLLVLTLLYTSLGGQETDLAFKNLNVENGLSQANINILFQDSRGFIWIGTEDGLNKYDGYNFTVYKSDINDPYAIGYNEISSLSEDSKGNIWVGTYKGISKYDAELERFTAYNHHPEDTNGLSDPYVYGIDIDSKDQIWAGTKNGLNCLDASTSKITRYYSSSSPNSLISNDVTAVKVASNGKIWIGTRAMGICIYNPAGDKFIQIPYDKRAYFEGKIIQVIREDAEKKIWIGTDQGLYVTDTLFTEIDVYTQIPGDPNSLNNNWIYGITFDKTDIAWLATDNGLSKFDRKTKSFINYVADNTKENTLTVSILRSILFDRDDRIWVGTRYGGIDVSDPHKILFQKFQYQKDNPYGLPHNNVQNFADAGNGNFWVVTDGGGLSYYNRSENKFITHKYTDGCKNCINSNKTLALCADDNGLWIGSWDAGIVYYDLAKGTFKEYRCRPDDPTTISSDRIWNIYKDPENRIWISMWDNGLSLYDREKDNFTRIYSNGKNVITRVGQVVEDKEGFIWIASQEKGLSRLNPKNLAMVNYMPVAKDTTSLTTEVVYSLLIDSKERLWVGTKYGLELYLGKGKFKLYTEKDGLPNNSIYGIREDSHGYLWISTNFGICRFDTERIEFRNFTDKDGLQGNQFNRWSIQKLSTGEMLFGGINGFNLLNPDKLNNNTTAPAIYITGLKIGNMQVKPGEKGVLKKSVLYTEKIKLKHDQNFLSIDFIALNYTQSERNRYKYMLKGVDKDWVDAGNQRTAVYTNLSAGRYTFVVKGSNNDGVWNEEGKSIMIRIFPPWWKSWWFITLVGLLTIYAVYYYLKMRSDSIKHDKAILQGKIDEGQLVINSHLKELEEQKIEIADREAREKEMRFQNLGLAKFGTLISQNRKDLTGLCRTVISELVPFINTNAGAVFISNKVEDEPAILTLAANYCFTTSDRANTSFIEGEGYVGTCFAEKKSIQLDDLPDTYVLLESGLGNTALNHMLLVPVIHDEIALGVIEIASLKKIEPYMVRFVQSLAESLASVLAISQANEKMVTLLKEINMQQEELKAQKEELRQNLEEMQATQEETVRREEVQRRMIIEKERSIAELKEEVESLKKG
jgi:ligand-binding sensor domain-containing protein